MPKPKLIRSAVQPYHVRTRVNNRDWFYVPMEECWNILTRRIRIAQDRYDLKVHAFVLMSNHFHGIFSTPGENLDVVMRDTLTQASREIGRRSSRINHVFGGRYKWTIIGEERHYAFTEKYAFRNPVRAGICRLVEEYDYSSISVESAIKISPPARHIDALIPQDLAAKLEWLNVPPVENDERLIKAALRRAEFHFAQRNENKPIVARLTETYLPKGDEHLLG